MDTKVEAFPGSFEARLSTLVGAALTLYLCGHIALQLARFLAAS